MKYFFLFLILSLALNIFSQDRIYFFNGTYRNVKLIRVGNDSIFFTLPREIEKINFINRRELLYIKYGDGKILEADTSFFSVFKPSLEPKTFCIYKNILSIQPVNTARSITISFEKILSGNFWGMYFPLSFMNLFNGFSAGAGLNFYPLRIQRNTCFLGILMLVGSTPKIDFTKEGTGDGVFWGINLDGGFKRQITPDFSLTLNFSIGLRTAIFSTLEYSNGGMGLGYCF